MNQELASELSANYSKNLCTEKGTGRRGFVLVNGKRRGPIRGALRGRGNSPAAISAITVAANPLYTNSMIDSCAFDPKFEPEASASKDILALANHEKFQLIVAHSTQKEIDHPNTPAEVKKLATERIYSLPVGLTPDEQRTRSEIHRILTGSGKPENVSEDAQHVFEAQKYGGHFITTDGRILERADELRALCGICIIKPSAFLAKVRALLPP